MENDFFKEILKEKDQEILDHLTYFVCFWYRLYIYSYLFIFIYLRIDG